MAAAVIDVDLARDMEDAVGLDGYTQAYVLVRYHGTPVGHFWTDVRQGRIPAGALSREGLAAAQPALSRRWFERQLHWSRSSVGHPPSAAIAICTRDRPHDLTRALRAIIRIAGREHPLLVVDNRPTTGATADVVAAHPSVRYIREDTPGLNAARNRALREAATDVVAFCDDDAVPETAWLDALRNGFDHPLVAGVAGLTLPLELETEAQEWFERVSPFGRGYFRHEFDPLHCTPQSAGQVGAGVNMAVRRDVVLALGGFDERLDVGTPARSGGDHELFARLLTSGYRLVYDPAAVSWHLHRRTWPELRRTLEGYGTGVYAMWTGRVLERGDLAVLKQAARWFFGAQLPQLAKSLARRPTAMPRDLVLAELTGCVKGPIAWFASARAHRARRAAA
jgi:GT2 family glycosyltransferase